MHGPDDELGQSQEKRPSAKWVILLTCAIVVVPLVALEWKPEQNRWAVAQVRNDIAKHDFAGAIARLDDAIQLEPENVTLRYFRSTAYLEWTRLTRPWRQRAGDSPPASAQIQKLLAQAVEDAEFVVDRLPRLEMQSQLSEMYVEIGQGEKAVALMKTLLDLPDGRDPDVMLNMCAYMRACANVELEEGLKQVETALSFLPQPSQKRALVVDTRGYLYYQLGKYDEALEDFNEAVDWQRENNYESWVNDLSDKVLSQRSELDWFAEDIRRRETFGTLLYHRMLAYRKLEKSELAQEDLAELQQVLPGYTDELLR